MKIIQKPTKTLYQHRKMIELSGVKVPYTVQVFTCATTTAVQISVFDRIQALDLSVLLFTEESHEGIDWWALVAQNLKVSKIEGKLHVIWKDSMVNYL